jgi:hypothetical protein
VDLCAQASGGDDGVAGDGGGGDGAAHGAPGLAASSPRVPPSAALVGIANVI